MSTHKLSTDTQPLNASMARADRLVERVARASQGRGDLKYSETEYHMTIVTCATGQAVQVQQFANPVAVFGVPQNEHADADRKPKRRFVMT